MAGAAELPLTHAAAAEARRLRVRRQWVWSLGAALFLLGVAAGAGLGATLSIAYGKGTAAAGDLVPLAAFGGATGAVVLAYTLGRSAGAARGPAALALAGITVASFLTAVQTFVQQ